MEPSLHDERQARAARNEALFREVNKRLEALNEAFEHVTNTYAIACECADAGCVTMIEIAPRDYEAVRADSRSFVVQAGHLNREVEKIVREADGYVVVAKIGEGAEVAEILDR